MLTEIINVSNFSNLGPISSDLTTN